jgi:CubicO group peptidase (beta-lactamase class C family)
MIFRSIIGLLMMMSSCSYAQQSTKNTEEFLRVIDKKMPQLLQDFAVPGAAIAIIENSEIILQKGYGYADIEKENKVTSKTGFNIASISKTITAWGIMKLVQQEKIDLDAPAEKYLTRWKIPNSEFDSDEVTIRRLLSHTAGLSLDGYGGWTPDDTLPTIEESLNGQTNGSGRVEIIMKPGTKYQYSGGGYTVLQLVIEEVSGQRFEEFMQEQILNPLGMSNSSFKIDDKILISSASEYDNFGEHIAFELFTAQAAAGLHTTIEDFTNFALANLLKNKHQVQDKYVLSPEIIQQMMEPQPKTNEAYGLGYELDRGNLTGLIGHTGGNTGWQSMFKVNPQTNDGFIVFTNGGSGYNIINAVLCEWVNWNTGVSLWEGCHLKPSIAHKLKQVIDDKGIENITASYMTLKKEQPDIYNFSENQLNNLGYFYMVRKELEKAIAIFKLNMEVFPNSYNVYDSFGEALLANSDRKEAIDNYLKSLRLNPGNAHGLSVLNDLGISTDDLIKNIAVSVDTEIIEGYTGQYQSSTGKKLTIQRKEAYLSVEMQGKEFKLVAQSMVRFQTLGDGSTFTFFTAADNQKGLWAEQTIWQKISERTTETTETHKNENFLMFRNNPSWGRHTDFENVLAELDYNYELRESNSMSDIDLSSYDVIIIPGGQRNEFYEDYVIHTEKFDNFVSNGGTLILELNGAEEIVNELPRGITLSPNKAIENAILKSDHPIFLPLSGKPLIKARYASMSYFKNVPSDALILAAEAEESESLNDRPTFIEYTYDKGRVIAASQCFHDRDDSGRGPLMESVISYAITKSREKED